MTKYETAKSFLAARDYHIRVYADNPDRYELWADGARQGCGTTWEEMHELLDAYLEGLKGGPERGEMS